MLTRILVVTVGSLGDVYPMVAIAQRLEEHGAAVLFAAPEQYREIFASLELDFVAIGSPTPLQPILECGDHMLPAGDANVAFMDRTNFQDLPRLYDDLYAASTGMDAVVALFHVVPAHLVAERRGIPFIACTCCPVVPRVTESAGRHHFGMPRWQLALSQLRAARGLRRKILPYAAMFENPRVVLGCFPEFLSGKVEERSIRELAVVGFPVMRQREAHKEDREVSEFCDHRTVVFSFGSYADACAPLHFFAESVAACRAVGLKCLYLSRFVTERSESDVLVRGFVPHDAVFPQVAVIVHHGGMGTLMAAFRHTKPMIIVPFLLDQPFNARQMRSLIGAGLVPARQYHRATLSAALRNVLADMPRMKQELASLQRSQQDGGPWAASMILEIAREGRATGVLQCP